MLMVVEGVHVLPVLVIVADSDSVSRRVHVVHHLVPQAVLGFQAEKNKLFPGQRMWGGQR